MNIVDHKGLRSGDSVPDANATDSESSALGLCNNFVLHEVWYKVAR